MPKRKINFIGFLTNVDDSILKLNLGQPFAIEKKSQQDDIPFLRYIDMHWGLEERLDISAVEKLGDTIVRGRSFYCIMARNVTSFEGTSQGGVAIKIAEVKRIVRSIRDRIRLLRLYKEGNILLDFSCMYYIKNSEPSAIWTGKEGPIADKTKLHLENSELSDAQSFIETMKIPFNKPSLQLAFEAFELSYEVYDLALSFLTLVTGLEAILNREHYELRYRVSRNSAVLLGKDLDEAKAIFKGMKELYDKRSKLVHTGDRSIVSRDDVLKLRQYVREALKKVHRTGMNKDQLLTLLNTCGFGQRPWRNGE